ncbi:M56 family metallopeptidase [Aquimarina sp. MMG016]|uniref:M56 family metallopeptidase n=1 Tax=Aquimarina sp. MMG016 TaxID=2822690 RepID=UPI001B3A1515|nr:M56 family metallopeptidase [Aquimarina sp. MMG016]MBQ4820891.1 energy transducer TonB [Aquimarina sp. MMG016]
MLYYILQTLLFQLLFLIIYDVFHKKDTFFSLNRAYLLITSVLSFVLPFIKIKSIQENIPEEYAVNLPTIFIGQQPENILAAETVTTIQNTSYIFDNINWWIVIYVSGVILMLLHLISKSVKLRKLRTHSTHTKIGNYKLLTLPKSKDAFSFWNTIYLGDRIPQLEKERIIAHEIVHLEQKHSLDLLWFEMLKIIFWFNPLVYVYQSNINTLHEFIADAKSVGVLGKRKYYEQLLNTVFDTEDIKFINQFYNHSLLKKRILMLQKSKSKAIVKYKYLVILPILTLMIVLSSFVKDQESLIPPMNKQTTDKLQSETNKIHYNNLQKNNTTGTNIDPKSTKNTEAPISINDTEKKELENKLSEEINNKTRNTKHTVIPQKLDFPFDEVEKTPTTESCKDIADNTERKKCVSDEIKKFVNENFNIAEMRKYAQPDMNRIYVRFKIDTLGNIADIQARGPAPEMQKEATRVIKLLPQMIPGEHKGQKVSVLYTLPIVFFNSAKTEENKIQKKPVITEGNIISENLTEHLDHDIKSGYYLITNIFKHKNYLDKMLKKFNELGLPAKMFKNPKDGYSYVYLGRYDTLEEAKKKLLNNLDKRYYGDMYILKVYGK